MKQQNKQQGFTLIELLVVVAILGILAAVVSIVTKIHRTPEREQPLSKLNHV